MSFVNPQFFWMLIIPFVILSFFISRNKERLSRIFDAKVLKRLSASDDSMSVKVRNMLMFLAIFLMIVALARPVIEKGDKKVEVQGLTVLTALDISGSMRSTDVYPNRLEFAKKKMISFFDAMPSDEIGALAFAYSPFVLAPFTSDKETLKMMVEGVDDTYINMGSTDFFALGEQIADSLEEKNPKIVVVFSDGGDEEALSGFRDILNDNQIDLHVVLVGTEKGAPVIDAKGNPYSQEDGTIAITQRNDDLGKVAEESGGAFVIAGTGKRDIEKLVSTLRWKYKNKEQAEVTIKERIEYFYYPLGFSLLFLLIAFSSIPRRREI